MIAEHSYRVVKRSQIIRGAGLHQSAFHYRQDEARQLGAIYIRGQPITGLHQPTLDTAGPVFEIPMDQTSRVEIAVADFERQVPDRTPHPAAMPHHTVAILIE